MIVGGEVDAISGPIKIYKGQPVGENHYQTVGSVRNDHYSTNTKKNTNN
jgi:hypothetical protein